MPLPAPTSQVHGLNGALTIAGTQMDITEWSGEDTADIKDGTTTINAGWKSWVPGIRSLSGTFKAIWDTSQNPYLVSIVPNTFGALKLYIISNLNITGNANSFYALTAIIKSISVSEPVGDLVTYTCSFESHGVVTTPS